MIKCNSCMQPLEIGNIEAHLMKYHFEVKDSVSEKRVLQITDTSSTTIKQGNNQFNKKSKHFKEIIFVLKGLHSLNEVYEKLFHNYPSVKKHIKIKSTEKLVCNTCMKEIDSEICRILITQNIDNCPQFFSFHFFAPCWNFEDFSQKYSNLALDKVIFSIPENIPMSEKSIKDLQSNLSFWD